MNDLDAFERGYVAVSYLLGRRTGLLDGLVLPGDAARRAASIADVPAQTERARRLATEILPLIESLESRGLR